MTRDDVIEVMTDAIAVRACQDEECRDPGAEPGGCLCAMHAIAALSALEAAGIAIVPVNATEAMYEAGVRYGGNDNDSFLTRRLLVDACYRAMLLASPFRNTNQTTDGGEA
jgi:hypothetical protein